MPVKSHPRHLTGIIFLVLCLAILLLARPAMADDTFTITFKNYNKTADLYTVECAAGEIPVYAGNVPTRSLPSGHGYTFAGWQPEIVPAAADAVYVPVFDVSSRLSFTAEDIGSDGKYIAARAVLPDKYPALDEGVSAELSILSDADNILTTALALDDTDMARLIPAREVILHTQQGDISLDKELLGYLAGLGSNLTIRAATATAVNADEYAGLSEAQKVLADSADDLVHIAFYRGNETLIPGVEGSFTVVMPYTPEDSSALPTVTMIADDGNGTRIPAAYSCGRLSFTARQSGYYAISGQVVTEDAFTIALVPDVAAVSAGQQFTCRAVLTQTAKTAAGGSVQAFNIPIAFDANLTYQAFRTAKGLNVQAQCSGSRLTLISTDAANGFTLASGESITLGEVTFRAPQDEGIFSGGKYTVADIGIADGSNEIAISGRQNGVAAQAAATQQPVVCQVQVIFPEEFIGYTIDGIEPGTAAVAVYGQPFSFTLTPADGYTVPSVSADGRVITPQAAGGGNYTYTLPAVQASVTIAIEAIAAEYSITYMDASDTGGARVIDGLSPVRYTFGAGAELPDSAPKAGYHLAGWYTDAACTGQAVNAIGTADFGDKVFYAKWTANELVLTAGSHTAYSVKGSPVQQLDLAGFIADDGGTDGRISIAPADGEALPEGLLLADGIISGAPLAAGTHSVRMAFVSPTGAAAELLLVFEVQDIIPLTINYGNTAVSFTPIAGHIEQSENIYILAGAALQFRAVADTGYIIAVSAVSGGQSRVLTPDADGVYTLPADQIDGAVTLDVQVSLDPASITVYAPTRDDVTGSGVIFQPFSVYSGSRTLVLFNVHNAGIEGLALSDGTPVYRTAHYAGYTHAALLDTADCPQDGLMEYLGGLLQVGTAANAELIYNNDVNGSGTCSVTDISVLYDFTSRSTLQWQPDDRLLLVGDIDGSMSLDAADVAALAAVYMKGNGQ